MAASQGPNNGQITLRPAKGSKANAGKLSLRHLDGVPVLAVTGGREIPTELFLLNDDGQAVAVYNLSYDRPEENTSTSTLPDERQLTVTHNGFFPCDVKVE